MSAHSGDEVVEVGLVGGEDEGIIDVDDYAGCFRGGGAIEQAGVEREDIVLFR